MGAAGITGTVSVTASGGTGCGNTAATSITASIIAPKPGTITRTPAACVNRGMTDTLTFSVTAVAGTIYQWILPAGWIAASSNVSPYSTYTAYSTGATGTTYVKVRGQSTCSGTTYYSAYDSVAVITNGIGTALTITKTPLDSDLDGIQDGENLTVNAVANPVRYQWYNASGEITGETTRFLDLLNAGTPSAAYFVRVAKNGCQTQVNTTSNYAYARIANTGASVTDLMAQVKVYPVPATDVVNIDLPMSYNAASVDFVDMTGASLLSKNLHGKSAAVNISKLDAGSYYMLFTVDGTSFSKKIVVTK